MRILAIDTSGKAASVAVADGSRLLGRIWLEHGRTHSQALMPSLEALLSSLDKKVSDMDAFAVAVGPGSFTGLRIGVTTAKTLAFVNNAKIAAVSTFECLAYNLTAYSGNLLCPIIDARNRQVYYQIFVSDGGTFTKVSEEDVADVEDVARKLKLLSGGRHPNGGNCVGGGVVFNGDAAETYLNFFSGQLGGVKARCACERDLYTDAASVALIVGEEIEQGKISRLEEPFSLSPNYMRKPQAERLREEAARLGAAVKR